MVFLEAGKTMEELSLSNEIKDGTVLPIPMEETSPSSSTKEGKNSRKS